MKNCLVKEGLWTDFIWMCTSVFEFLFVRIVSTMVRFINVLFYLLPYKTFIYISLFYVLAM